MCKNPRCGWLGRASSQVMDGLSLGSLRLTIRYLKFCPKFRETELRIGLRDRPSVTWLDTIELKDQRHRNVPFMILVLDNCEAALVTTMAEMIIGGVSTAKVGRAMEKICGTTFSKQAVSEACKVLDSTVSK